MWSTKYTVKVSGISKEAIWKTWTDPELRPLWDHDTESCRLVGKLEPGSYFILKQKGFFKLKTELLQINPNQKIVDCTYLFGAKILASGELIEESDGLQIVVTMGISGTLSYIWRKLVMEKYIATLPQQTETQIQLAKSYEQKE